ncbi:hypothetical protein P3L10_015741 [Capsicum annuum]
MNQTQNNNLGHAWETTTERGVCKRKRVGCVRVIPPRREKEIPVNLFHTCTVYVSTMNARARALSLSLPQLKYYCPSIYLRSTKNPFCWIAFTIQSELLLYYLSTHIQLY